MGLQMTEKMQSEKWCVVSRLVWWFCTVSCFDKIILNQCACWGGSVLWQLFFWCHFFSSTFVNCFFPLLQFFHLIEKINNYLMNTCNMFLNKKNNYRMPFYNPPKKKIKKTAPKHFFKGVPHQQDWHVCCGGPLLCPAFFEVKIGPIPVLVSFSFPFLKLFSFTFLSPFFWIFEMSNFPKYGRSY